MPQKTLVVIPARGGSKGVPRKNVAPLAGRPLIAWVIASAREAAGIDRVVVSTEDTEIAGVAQRFGADVVTRPERLAEDTTTLDPVVADAVSQLEREGEQFDFILTVQPTSPLLKSTTLERIISRMANEPIDTIISSVDATHLGWRETDSGIVPDYAARVNRQALPRRFRETGGVLATRRAFVSETSRIGPRVALEVLDHFEGLDIDTREDWLVAEAALHQKRIAFVTIGNPRQGLGHVTRTRTLLECLNGHNVRVFTYPSETLAIEQFQNAYYEVEVVEPGELLDALKAWKPHIVCHDELENDPDRLRAERNAGMKVVVFEDTGPGEACADKAFNALFPEDRSAPEEGRWYGPDVYCLRDDFTHGKRYTFREQVQRILCTFGGTDPARITFKVLDAIAEICPAPITVIAGRGMQDFEDLERRVRTLSDAGKSIRLLRDVVTMSDEMANADIAFSSSGRTLYELAHVGVPTIVLAQNDTEMRHTFAQIENGFLFLGRADQVSAETIVANLESLLGSAELRRALHQRMRNIDLTRGRDRVIREILEL